MEFIIIGLILFIIIAILVFIILTYNKLVTLRNKVKNSWAHIDAQLQRRFDLVPSLVEVIKGFTTYERDLFEDVIAIKGKYMSANTNGAKLEIDSQLNSYLKKLCFFAEKEPKLKTNMQFLKLQNALTEIEEDISYARQFYNDAVTIYNNKLMLFPNNIIANLFNFKEETLFDAVQGAEFSPRINFNNTYKCPSCGAIITSNSSNCQYCGCFLR